jgi:hypothetical protein
VNAGSGAERVVDASLPPLGVTGVDDVGTPVVPFGGVAGLDCVDCAGVGVTVTVFVEEPHAEIINTPNNNGVSRLIP